MSLFLDIVEWIVIALSAILLYAWVGYPLLLAVVSGSLSKLQVKGSRLQGRDESEASITIIVAAHNEEMVIADRIQNLIECRDRLIELYLNTEHRTPNTKCPTVEICIGLDGCTDGTSRRARKAAGDNPDIHIHEFADRRGKMGVIKDIVQRSRFNVQGEGEEEGEHILVFTDANTTFKQDTLEQLLKYFADPDIGGVCGRLVFSEPGRKSCPRITRMENDPASASTEPIYWNRFETWLKRRESCLDSCLGANGAIYAVRKSCFWPDIPGNTIVDDFVIGMKVREVGKRMVYEPGAVAEEDLPNKEEEWGRRVRIGSGDYQALSLCRKCLSPRYGWFSWIFFSHKVLRWFTPHVGLSVVLCSWCVIGYWFKVQECGMLDWKEWVVAVVAAGSGLLLLAAGIGRAMRGARTPLARPFQLVDHFATMQAALFVGWLRYLRGDLKGSWKRTGRGR